MFLLIDNYDSFTYNLVQAFCRLGKQPVVIKNDDPELVAMATDPRLKSVCISPGPGHPSEAGFCMEFLRRLSPRIPVLGVCLGHQVLGLFAGSEVVRGPVIMHGKTSDIVHNGRGLYRSVPNPMTVGRYHSLVVRIDEQHPNSNLEVTARGPQGEVMSMRYKDRPWVGVQYHPESILTPDGLKLLKNFPENIMPAAEIPSVTSILNTLADQRDLTVEQAEAAFNAMIDGTMSPTQAGSFLTALRMKGEKPQEVAAAIHVMLDHAVRVRDIPEHCIDIVGTGGDGKHSFNCSTASALTIAGMGYRCVKHGNRAVSSTSGAADALEGLGMKLERDPEAILDALRRTNFTFQFAPYFHPAFANIAPVRKQLGIRTIFNILGPMINPACPDHLMMGVGSPDAVELVAGALSQRPIRRIAVFHGAGGYDELTCMGKNRVILISDGKRDEMIVDPQSFGFSPCSPEDLEVHTKEEAVQILRDLLSGNGPKAMQDMIALNAGFAVFLLEDGSVSLEEAVAKARRGVLEGAGSRVLA
ncbi:MAG: anthranilate phosphoribosyltransferase [Desulfovibrionaceae bacterium]|nr:anthranilate phosphoribosyltransferase [Desulfovibrionaceae bacterium]